jgi:hypothetical protein
MVERVVELLRCPACGKRRKIKLNGRRIRGFGGRVHGRYRQQETEATRLAYRQAEAARRREAFAKDMAAYRARPVHEIVAGPSPPATPFGATGPRNGVVASRGRRSNAWRAM